MTTHYSRIINFWKELKRRKVIQVVTVYAASAFVILELVDILAPSLRLPEWTLNLVLLILCVGFVIAIILSWIYDIQPEGGIARTEAVEKHKAEEIQGSSRGWKIASYISFAVIAVLLVMHVVSRNDRSGKKEVPDKSIAVLPFGSLSDDPEKQYLADGVMEAILLHLSRIEDLRVTSRTSVEQYRNTEKTVNEISAELNVAFILEGSFQKYGDQAKLTVTLIKPGEESNVWSNEYDRIWKDIFVVQGEVAKAVARELASLIKPEEVDGMVKMPTRNLKAYELYLTGRGFWNRWIDEDIRKGMDYFQKAIHLDPEFALAYAGLANAYNTVSFYSLTDPEETYPKAKELAQKALEIDPQLPEAHIALAYVKIYYDWDWEGGEKEFRRAIELDPENVTAHHLYAYSLILQTRYGEAMNELGTALALDPSNLILNRTLGDFYFHMRDYEKAEDQLIKTLEMDPAFNYAHAYLGMVYLQESRCEQAIAELRKEIEYGTGTEDVALAWQGFAFGKCGKIQQGKEILEVFLDRSEHEYIPPSFLAWQYFALGEYDAGFTWLHTAFDERDTWLTELKNSHFFDPIRSDSRYMEMLEKMNLND